MVSPTAWKILEGFCTGTLRNFVCYVQRTPQQLCLLSAPEPSATSPPSEPEPSGTPPAICTKTVRKRVCFLPICHRTLHKPCLLSAPEPSEPHQPSGTLPNLVCTTPFENSSAICTDTLWNFISHLHWNHLRRNPPEFHQPSAPEPSGTSSSFCATTLQNFISHLHRNPPEPHQPSAPEPSGTLSAICTGTRRLSAPDGTLWNFISFLHRNPPEPHQLHRNPGNSWKFISHLHRNPPEPHQPSAPEPSGTLRNLFRNLVLQLHRIAPELFWAKDPIASFAVGEKKQFLTRSAVGMHQGSMQHNLINLNKNRFRYIWVSYLYIWVSCLVACFTHTLPAGFISTCVPPVFSCQNIHWIALWLRLMLPVSGLNLKPLAFLNLLFVRDYSLWLVTLESLDLWVWLRVGAGPRVLEIFQELAALQVF